MSFAKLLEISGLTINQLCVKYSIPLRTAYHWLNGSRRPPDYVLLMLFDILTLEGVISHEERPAH